MIQDLANQLVIDFNMGKPMSFLAKKYRMQHPFVKTLLLESGSTLRRPEFLSESELIHLSKKMTLDEMAEYLYVQPITLKRHLRKRKINLPATKSKDDLYIEKQVKYLFSKENMSIPRIARSLSIEINRVRKIIAELQKDNEIYTNRCYNSSVSSLGESGGKFIEYHDLANVFPKQRKYARAY